jgi:hypothetical protein
LAEETGKSANTIRTYINDQSGTDKKYQLSELSGTDKHRPFASSVHRVALGEKEILEAAREIQSEKRFKGKMKLGHCPNYWKKKNCDTVPVIRNRQISGQGKDYSFFCELVFVSSWKF